MSQGNRIARHRVRQGRSLRGFAKQPGARVRVGTPPNHAVRYEYPHGSDLAGWQVGLLGPVVIYVADEETASRLRDYLLDRDEEWKALGGPKGGRR